MKGQPHPVAVGSSTFINGQERAAVISAKGSGAAIRRLCDYDLLAEFREKRTPC
jgi:hypothetical protein